MGAPFLRAYYSIYDMENERIGLVGVATTLRTPILDQEDISNMQKETEKEDVNRYILPQTSYDDMFGDLEGHGKVVAEILGLDSENK